MPETIIESLASERADEETGIQSGYDILTYPADFTLEVLDQKWKRGDIRLAPGQRRYIWSQTRASKLIESFLIGLPVPPVFFYQEKGTNNLLVVDGQQRLLSIVFFFSGKFGTESDSPIFNLVGLSDKSKFRDMTYHQLKNESQEDFNKLQNSVMRSFVVKQLDPHDDTSIFEMFERLNTGGVSLTPQEVRNCIYRFPLTTVLNDLNKTPEWRKLIGGTEDRRMRDVELILRFMALRWSKKGYSKPMKKFLNDFMKGHEKSTQEELRDIERDFKRTTRAVLGSLGEKPFHVRRGLNAAVFDAVFTAFAKNLDDVEQNYTTKKARKTIASRYRHLIRNSDFTEWTISATTDQDIVPQRLKKAEAMLFG